MHSIVFRLVWQQLYFLIEMEKDFHLFPKGLTCSFNSQDMGDTQACVCMDNTVFAAYQLKNGSNSQKKPFFLFTKLNLKSFSDKGPEGFQVETKNGRTATFTCLNSEDLKKSLELLEKLKTSGAELKPFLNANSDENDIVP